MLIIDSITLDGNLPYPLVCSLVEFDHKIYAKRSMLSNTVWYQIMAYFVHQQLSEILTFCAEQVYFFFLSF